MAAHSKDAGYQAPEVTYQISDKPCQPVTITKDTRTAQAKLLAAKLEDFQEQFGAAKPFTSLVTFRIVGLVATPNYDSTGFSISNLVQTMLTSTQISNFMVPQEAVKQHPILGKLDFSLSQEVWGSQYIIVEFADREHQKAFMTNESCNPGMNFKDCEQPGKFMATPYGNPIAVLYEARDATKTFLMWVLGIIAALSALITMVTIGKVIADSRKETSVFRALGATRSQIAQIYLLYALMLGGLSFAFAFVVGGALALLIDLKTSAGLSVEAATALNTANLDKQFHLIGWNPLDLGLILALVLLTAILGACLPLLTNVRRNPINDMRNE
jgi:ABC-type antimicrobial peptide transport system permease subunit